MPGGEQRNLRPPYEGTDAEIIADWRANGYFPEDEPYGDFVGIVNPTGQEVDKAVYGPDAVSIDPDTGEHKPIGGQSIPLDTLIEE